MRDVWQTSAMAASLLSWNMLNMLEQQCSFLKNKRANNYRKSKLFLGAKSFTRNLNLHSPLLVPDPIVLASPFDAGLVVKKLLPSFLFIIQP